MKDNVAVGFDRRVDLAWLDAVAGQVARGATEAEVRAYLARLLDGVVSGGSFNSARGKTITVLCHVWSSVPDGARPMRGRAVALLGGATPEERLAIHWAMVLGTYPFATDVATALGRVLALHETAGLTQTLRKITAKWGERSTVVRATQRLVRSMVEWGALRDGEVRGTFQRAAARKLVAPGVSLLLIEAVLLDARAGRIRLRQLLSHPALFPFVTTAGVPELRSAPYLRLAQTANGEDEVWLSGTSGEERARG